jgi:hypothetical protein
MHERARYAARPRALPVTLRSMPKTRETIDDMIDAHAWMRRQEARFAGTDMTNDDPVARQRHVYQKIGELVSDIGLYDMAVLGCTLVLTEEPVLKAYAKKWMVNERHKMLLELLEARGGPSDLIQELKAIHGRMQEVLNRRGIVAHNPALTCDPQGVLIARRFFEQPQGAMPSDWLHPLSEIEADCNTAIKCYHEFSHLGPRIKAVADAARVARDQQGSKRLGLL